MGSLTEEDRCFSTSPCSSCLRRCASGLISEYEGRPPDTVVAVKLLPPGTKLFDFEEETKELVVSLYLLLSPYSSNESWS